MTRSAPAAAELLWTAFARTRVGGTGDSVGAAASQAASVMSAASAASAVNTADDRRAARARLAIGSMCWFLGFGLAARPNAARTPLYPHSRKPDETPSYRSSRR